MTSTETGSFTLSTGAKIPAIGLGTYLSRKKEVENAVEFAVRNGYRHLDLALIYGNQHEVSKRSQYPLNQHGRTQVGAALKKVIPSIVERHELFITTKLWNSSHHPSDVEKDLDLSLKQLGVDYVDLYLMHWPVALKEKAGTELDMSVTIADTWKAMAALLDTGKVKAIGVSNFTISHIKDLIAATGITPAVNQVELHPYLHQDDLLAYCKKTNIHITAYFPIGGSAAKGKPSLLEDAVVNDIAAKYNATPAQVLLAWGLSRGYSVIPKSITPDRIKSNLKRITSSSQDLQRITDIGKNNQIRFLVPAMFKWDINVFETPREQKRTHRVLISNKANM